MSWEVKPVLKLATLWNYYADVDHFPSLDGIFLLVFFSIPFCTANALTFLTLAMKPGDALRVYEVFS